MFQSRWFVYLILGVLALVAVVALSVTAEGQETPASAPVRAWGILPQLQFCEYRFASYNAATPPGTTVFWLYHHDGTGRAGQQTVVTMWAASWVIPDGGATFPLVLASGCDPNGRLSWLIPDSLTPISMAGIPPFSPDWLARGHQYNTIAPLGMYVPTTPSLIGTQFYIEGAWWLGTSIPPVGAPCGTIGTPLIGPGSTPCPITFRP